MMGAGRVIAIDREPERLRMAAEHSKAEIVNFEEVDGPVHQLLIDLTDGRGPDRCIDAVGAEAHAANDAQALFDKARDTVLPHSDHPYVLQQAIMACRKGGTVSVPGVYAKTVTIPFGAAMNKGLTFKMGQTHVQRYLDPLMRKIESGEIDPSFIITHTAPLDDAPRDVRDVPRQEGRLHQGGLEAVTPRPAGAGRQRGIGPDAGAGGPLRSGQEKRRGGREADRSGPLLPRNRTRLFDPALTPRRRRPPAAQARSGFVVNVPTISAWARTWPSIAARISSPVKSPLSGRPRLSTSRAWTRTW